MKKYFEAMQQTQKMLANRQVTRGRKLPSIPNPNVELIRSLTPKEESTAKSLVKLAHRDYKKALDTGAKGNNAELSFFRSNMSYIKGTLASHHRLTRKQSEQSSERTKELDSIRGMINGAYQHEPDSSVRGR